jgi:hypothetical protein
VARCDVPRRECFHFHITGRLCLPVPSGDDSVRDFCPAHDDRTRSLSISVGEKARIVWHCHAGCGALTVRAALIRNGVSADCLPVPKAEEASVIDTITALYAQNLSPPELRWRIYSVIRGFNGEAPARGAYPGGKRGFARDAGVSPADLYGLRRRDR